MYIFILIRAGSWIYTDLQYHVFRKNLRVLVELFKVSNVVRAFFFYYFFIEIKNQHFDFGKVSCGVPQGTLFLSTTCLNL